MMKLRFFFLICSMCALAAGCSSKKVQDADSAKTVDTSISSDSMSFDPQGSDSGKIQGLHTIHFPFNRAAIEPAERELLAQDAEWIKAHQKVSIQIEGNCDVSGSIEYNLALGERRAKAAKDVLVSMGVNPAQLSTISYGKEKLITTDDSDVEQAKNRRDNFVPMAK